MAYDSLKALIRQYIKTNGEQEITGQIMQNVLIEMVNQYPSTDGFATQSWVTSQGYITASALSGYATQSWVTTQLGDYLPLTGGTLTGALNIDKDASSIILDFGGIELAQSGSDFKIYANHDFITNKDSLIITNLVENTIGTIDIRHNNLSVDNSVTATSFVKSGGTSAQFLKADGSVDSNAYITSAALSGYATQSWVTTQLGSYLPLTGGTLTGALNIDKDASSIILDFGGIELMQSGSEFKIYANHDFITNKDSLIITNLVENTIGTIDIRHNNLSVDNSVTATSFVKSGGTSAQFLKADGSVDSNAYITSAALSGYATQSWVTTQLGSYLPLTGGTLTGALNIDKDASSIILNFGGIELAQSGSDFKIYANHDFITNKDSLIITNLVENTIGTIDIRHNNLSVDNSVTATSFVKSGGTSAQFLKADGSVDSNAYITLASVKGNLSVWNNTAMTWGTLTAANGYTIGVHASSSDGGDWGMCYKSGQISMQLDGWYYQNEGRYRVVDTSDLASYNPTTNFKTINNQSIIGTGNINIEGGGGGAYYDAEIEYLESTGTQYIDTGFYPRIDNTDITVEVKFNKSILQGDHCVLGARTGTGGNQGYKLPNFYNDVLEVQGLVNATGVVGSYSINTDYVFRGELKGGSQKFYVNGVLITEYTESTSSCNSGGNLYLLAMHQGGTIWYFHGKLYYCKIWQDGTLVRDFIPVRVGNVGYLYDKVSGQLFGNSGTGSFVLGQDTGPGGGLPYLPLTGGTITGNLTVNGTVKFNNNLTFAYDRGIKFGTDNNVKIMRDSSRLMILDEGSDDIIIGDYNNRNYTSIVNDLQGGTTTASYTSVSTKWYIYQDGTAQFKTVSQTSDLRKKTITGDVPMNIYNVANAPLFKFTWNDEKKFSGQHIGSAAQYWQTVLPELVSIGRDADMTLAMQYDVIALASAITVAKTVVNHEERIILLERENEALRQEIADLKSA